MNTTIFRPIVLALIFIPKVSFSQNVGIGTSSPGEKLHVVGNILTDTAKVNALQLTPNAGTGKILTSDDVGNATWEDLSAPPGNNDNVGYGVWGDCSTNAILSEYNPVVDTTGETGDYFGASVSISGNYAIVGILGDDGTAGNYQGSASIFQYDGMNWVLMEKITDADGAVDDFFGASVSISGNYAIVGAYSDDGIAGWNQGSASIFEYNGTHWVLMDKITDEFGAANDNFGISVSISGNYAIVGSSVDDGTAGWNQGSASIFEYNGTNWVLMEKITDATGAAEDYFGASVSISGNFAIVGAFGDDAPALTTEQGSASIYQYNGTNWVLMQRITDATGLSGDYFGYSVSISGNYAVVGADGDDGAGGDGQGSASIFHYNGNNWEVMKKITDATGAANDGFGFSVSISGNYAIVGAFNDDAPAPNQGSVSIYQRLGPAWQRLQYVTDPSGENQNAFGTSTAIDGTNKRFLIGASGFTSYLGKAVFGKIK